MLPPDASEANRAAFRAAYGLDQPLYVQYWRFLLHVAQGDFGKSISYHEDYQVFIANADGSAKQHIETGNSFNFGPQFVIRTAGASKELRSRFTRVVLKGLMEDGFSLGEFHRHRQFHVLPNNTPLEVKKDHAGIFAQARGGSVFLDELPSMSLAFQGKLLRVLQEREFERIGGNEAIRVGARFIAATNRDVRHEVHTGVFREDLFYRLNVISIHLPPLRERREDIIPLVEHFVEMAAKSLQRTAPGLSRELRHALISYDFPGNVREMRPGEGPGVESPRPISVLSF